MAPTVKRQIARLQKERNGEAASGDESDSEKSGDSNEQGIAQRLDKLEHLLQEMSDRLKSIENRLSQK